MIEALLGVALMAGLFVLAGIFRHRGCTGHCAGCDGACGRFEEGVRHDD
ncbi:MAG TPA: hypothetical protein VL241_08620 [Gemmatimonadales bacterium]|jgi:hypothetical protein|nr:hypothetical protein [Gemmatimonadales bacterium]